MSAEILSNLVRMANHLGDPSLDYAILGEGNVSARIDDASFYVTVSGSELRTVKDSSFVAIALDRVMPLLDAGDLSDDEIRTRSAAAKVDGKPEPRPSVEALMHAILLQVEGVNCVGHCHPTAINSITCSKRFEELLSGRLFPDEIVLCGPAPVLVPYVDPGVPLAREIHRRVQQYIETHRERPKVIYLQNHGFIALGSTPTQVLQITAMAVKAARILLGACAVGGPTFLSAANVKRIHNRPDEHYRQRVIGERGVG